MAWWWGFWIVMQFPGRLGDATFFGIVATAAIRFIAGLLAVRMICAITERQHHQIHMRDAQL